MGDGGNTGSRSPTITSRNGCDENLSFDRKGCVIQSQGVANGANNRKAKEGGIMSMTSHSSQAGRSTISRSQVTGLLTALVRPAVAYVHAMRTRRVLRSMPDYLLKDIGLSSHDLSSVFGAQTDWRRDLQGLEQARERNRAAGLHHARAKQRR